MNKLFDGNVLLMVALTDTLVRDVVEFSGSVGIAQVAGLTGENISVDVVGVYEFPVANADAVAVGDIMYWDTSASEATTVSTDNTLIGEAWAVKAGASDGSVGIKIG